MNSFLHKLLKAVLWALGIWAAVLISIEITMSTEMATKAVNKYASEYIDGDISFGNVAVSVLKRFPGVTLTLEDFSITYPSDRFDALERTSPQGHLLYHGCGETADTLASFQRFFVKLRPGKLLFGKVHISEVELVKPRIFAHSYNETDANWNIFLTEESTDSSEVASEVIEDEPASAPKLPKIEIGKIRLTDHPHVIYTDSKDTIFAMIDIKKAGFNGRLTTGKTSRNRLGMHIDSVFVAGRLAADTLALGIDKFHIHQSYRQADLIAKAKILAATRSFGRLYIPIEISSTIELPRDTVPAVDIHNLRANIAALPINGEAELRFLEDRARINGQLNIENSKVEDLIKGFVVNFIPEAAKIHTDAAISLHAKCNSEYIYSSDKLPECSVEFVIPDAEIKHSDFDKSIRFAFNADATVDEKGKADFILNKTTVSTDGLDLNLKAKAKDLLGKDPLFSIDGKISACIDSLAALLPDSLGIQATGNVLAALNGNARMSHLNMYNFSHAQMTGSVNSDKITFVSQSDSIDVNITGLDITLGPETITSRRDTTKSFKLIGITGKIGDMLISMSGELDMKGKDLVLSAKSSADGIDTTKVHRLSGHASATSISVADATGTSIALDNTRNTFMMMPKRNNAKVPVLALSSSNKRITLITDVNRAILTDASVKANATLNTVERRQKMRAFTDSLALVYPDVPRDSLFFHLMSKRTRKALPDWMTEEDFKQQDIQITLDETMKKYFRDWDLKGDMNIRTGILMTPYFPIRNILRGCEISVTNDRIAIDSLKFMSGKSEICAKGDLSGLRRAVLGRGTIKLDLDITSGGMDANELLTAFSSGSNFNPESIKGDMSEASNSDFFKMVTADTLAQTEQSSLLVIPANLNADIRVNANDISYSNLSISTLSTHLLMKERCVQVTNTMATSNMGEVSFEGFYATKTKKDIKAGFSINFKDITAEKAIDLVPAIDTIMPLLKSFAGDLNCEVAATASLDTNMNIIMPSINGVMRISGDNLSISDSDIFTSLAKKLRFNNKKAGNIKHMMVEGMIKDNVFEIFPFVISLDRYSLALSGKQNLDMSYRYHASLIKSPLLIRIGVDLYGPDFDHIKFKIGRPKYKNERVPVFSAVIDQTKINLGESIKNIFEKGVDAAVKENARMEAIAERKEEIGFVNAADQQLEELSEEEQRQYDESAEEEETTEVETTTETYQNNE